MKIIIANKYYDITEFAKEHPGGYELFINNSDMTKLFNEAGHSSYAVSLHSNFKSEPISESDPIYKNDSSFGKYYS